MFEHYASFIPQGVYDGVTFEKWSKTLSKEQQQSFVFDIKALMQHDAENITQQKFPGTLSISDIHLPLEYHFDPLDERDGATVTVPIIFLNDINPTVLEWGVYGFLYDKIIALLRALPKNIRKNCVPVPTYAQTIFESINFEVDRYKPLKSVIAKHITRIVGFVVDETIWHNQEFEKYLVLNIKVVDEQGKILAIDKDIYKLKQKLKNLVQKPKQVIDNKVYYDWEFGDITPIGQTKNYGINVKVYNCLEEYQDGVRISYKATPDEAAICMQNALKKIVKLRLQGHLLKSIKNNDLTSLSMSLKFNDSKDSVIDKAIDLSFFNIKKQANNVVIPDSDPESFDSDDNTKNSNEILNQVQDDRRGDVFGLPYTKQAFEAFYNRGLESFTTNKTKVELLFTEIVKAKEQLDKKLNVKKIAVNFIELFTAVRNELNELFADNYLSQPMPYLQRYKYYIQALENRLDKAKLNLQRDRTYQIEVDELKAKLEKKIVAKHFTSNSVDVTKISFLIKELWVSWYLQNVKTSESVSAKKILVYINEI